MSGTSNIEYKNCLVSFIDILGFSSMIENKSAEEIFNNLKKLRSFANVAGPFKRDLIPNSEISHSYASSISDGVVRVRPYETKRRDGALFRELYDLLLAQTDLLNEGILIRGGLTIGQCYVGNDSEDDFPVFGPALIDAIKIEKCAEYPQIIVDNKVIEFFEQAPYLRAEHNTYEWEKSVVSELLKKENGKWFINYLPAIKSECDSYSVYLEFLCRHAKLITVGLSKNKDHKVLEKYEWLKGYHNEYINGFKQHISDKAWIEEFVKATEGEIDPKYFFDCITIN